MLPIIKIEMKIGNRIVAQAIKKAMEMQYNHMKRNNPAITEIIISMD